MAKRKHTRTVPLLLPQPADEFIGKRAELDQLVRALQPGRTVTLVGAPGSGKRALAAAAIDRLRSGNEPPPLFPAGVVTLSCEQYPDDYLLLSALARALDGSAYPNLSASLAALLQGKQLLIVLEDVDALTPRLFEERNYQQIAGSISEDETGADETSADETSADETSADETSADETGEDEIGAQVDQKHVLAKLCALLDTGQCSILLTTSDPELTFGEVIELGPLSEAEGRALLAVYDEEVVDNLQQSTDIVAQLGGLPLSLTLAGNWMVRQDVQIADLYAALNQWRLAELPPDERRSAGLAAVVQLILREFDPDTRTTLRLLAMLSFAPLPVPMVSAIISPFEQEDDDDEPATDEALDFVLTAIQKSMGVLADLVDVGLLVEASGNLKYCHHQVQRLVLKQDSHEDAAGEQGFAARIANAIEHILMFAELADEKDAAFAPGLSAHLLHLQALLYANGLWAYVCDIGVRGANFFTLPGYWYELFSITKLAHRAVRRLDDPQLVVEHRLGIGLMLARLGFGRDATTMLTQALEAAEANGDEEPALQAAEALLQIYLEADDPAAARQSAERVLALAEQRDDPQLLALALAVLTQLLLQGEDKEAHLPRAVELTERALELQRRLGDQEGLLDAMLSAGAVWGATGDVTRALQYSEPAVDLARQLRDRVREAAALMNLGENYNRNGEARRALRTFEKALEAARRSNVKPLIALSSWRLANSVEQSGNTRAALKYYEQCLAVLDPAEVRDPTPAAVQAKIAALRG